MTMPWGSTEEPELEIVEEPTVAVHVVSSDAKPGKSLAAEFGQWRTVNVANVIGPNSVTPGAQRIANRSLRRHRLLIYVLPTVAAQPAIDGVLVGSPDIINSGLPAIPGTLMAGYLPIGSTVRWEVQQELWVCYPTTNTDAVFVTVCDEQYASDPDSWKENER